MEWDQNLLQSRKAEEEERRKEQEARQSTYLYIVMQLCQKESLKVRHC